MKQASLYDRLHLTHPIIQAPMAGGISTPELTAAVSNNGCLGMIAAGYLDSKALLKQIKEVKKKTKNWFGVNVFVPNDYEIEDCALHTSKTLLEPIHESLQINQLDVSLPESKHDVANYHQLIDVIIQENVPVCTFTFGLPSSDLIRRLKEQDIVMIGTATTVKEAIEIERAGLDMVILQGSEAGGHRATFLHSEEEGLIGLMALIPQAIRLIKIPVIAAGGIMDGRGLMASRCLGAAAVQMGTAFLTCIESGASDIHKQAVTKATDSQTTLTSSFSGKKARGINNTFIRMMQKHENDLPVFPIQNALTKSIRTASSNQNNREFMSLWSGQSPMLANIQTAEELIERVMEEAEEIWNGI
ncbi:NAD(P)H-dependent flavin oxidoreductase [Alkalicoccobacillus murimartini]|uniref:Probable nitronate monooxygenase n=1 Tax=Alkalicoccobacillus murimartini TaxID=171685 RepID=A0ABT9YP60_9BACI|nr:nitronate monooxygenase [Alkalicoccobacillus murimartini]MDQ0208814.1 nitronate monooxygenase [Alkalicoccobacillus murimartini]